jgi:hypothetical protein
MDAQTAFAGRTLIAEKLAEAKFQQFRRDIRKIFPKLYDLSGDEFGDRDFYYRHDP